MIPVHITGKTQDIILESSPIALAKVIVVVNGTERQINDATKYGKPVVAYYTRQHELKYFSLAKNVVEVTTGDSQPSERFFSIIEACARSNTEFTYPEVEQLKKTIHDTGQIELIVIASSTGGPATLEALFSVLPSPFPVPIVVVQHLPDGFAPSLVRSLNDSSAISVRLAQNDQIIECNNIYLASGGKHLTIQKGLNGIMRCKYVEGDRECGVRPSANYLFRSAAHYCKEKTLGIVLTGMGKDGLEGSREIKKNGGTILAQDLQSSVVYGMPKEVVMNGLADAVVSIHQLPVTLVELVEA